MPLSHPAVLGTLQSLMRESTGKMGRFLAHLSCCLSLAAYGPDPSPLIHLSQMFWSCKRKFFVFFSLFLIFLISLGPWGGGEKQVLKSSWMLLSRTLDEPCIKKIKNNKFWVQLVQMYALSAAVILLLLLSIEHSEGNRVLSEAQRKTCDTQIPIYKSLVNETYKN